MSNKHCGPDIVKYFVVEPSSASITGATDNFYVCQGTTFLKTISGCTDNVNLNGNIFYNSGEIFFNGVLTACTGIHTSNLYGCSPVTVHDKLILLSGLTITDISNDNSLSQILVRDNVDGTVKYRDVSTLNTYVNGFTYDDINTFTIFRNDGVNLTSTMNILSGVTYYGDGTGLFNIPVSGITNLISILDSKLDLSTFSVYSGDVQTQLDYKISGATNLSSEGIFKQKSGFDLEFKGLTSTGGTVSITSDSNTVNLEAIIPPDQNTFSTNGNVVQFATSGNSEVVIQIDGNVGFTPYLITGLTDTFINDFSYNSNTFTISQNDGSTFDTTIDTIGLESILSAVTFNIGTTGTISANVFSGGTYYGDGSNLSGITTQDNFVSGGTYNNTTRNIDFVGNSPQTTFGVDLTELVSSVSADTYVTGFTFNNTTYDLTLKQNNGEPDLISNLAVLATDVYVISGVYNPSTGIVTYTNSSGGTFQVSGFTTGMTDSYTVAASLNGETIEFDNNIQGSNFYSVNLSPILSGKTDLDLFNLHTGDTNNPHQTSFSNLTSTAHTHTISEIINLQSELDSKLDITTFNTYSGDVQTQLDVKIEGGVNSGGANEVFSGKSGTDLYFRTISGGSNTTISTIGDVIRVDVSIPADTNTFVTGGTYSSGTLTLDRNDGNSVIVTGFLTGNTLQEVLVNGNTTGGNDIIMSEGDDLIFKYAGWNNRINTEPLTTHRNILFQDKSGTVALLSDTTGHTNNFYVTGFTYNDSNTFTLLRNGGLGNLTSTINIVTGLTVNGDIEMGNASSRQIYSTGVSDISSVEFTTSGSSVQMRWDGSGNSTVLSINNTDFTTLSSNKTAFGGLTYGSDYSPYYTDRSLIDLGYFNTNNKYVTGGTYNNTTGLISYSGVNGFPSFNVDLSSLDLNDTYVTGGTLTQTTNNTNNGSINLLYSKDVSPSTYSIPYTDTFTTGATLNGSLVNFYKNDGSVYSVDLGSLAPTGFTDTYVTGTTFNSNESTLTRNDGFVVFSLSGTNDVTLTNPSTNQIVIDVNGLKYFISETSPTGFTLSNGYRWFNTSIGSEFVYIDDGDSSQWVQPLIQPGPEGPIGPQGPVGPQGPSGFTGTFITTGITTSAATLTTNYTYYGVSYLGNVDLTLPDPTGIDGVNIMIKDEGGNASFNRIRLITSVGLIDGNSSIDMVNNYQSTYIVARNNNWWII